MKRNQLAALILAVLMCLPILASCGGDGGQKPAVTAAETAAVNETEAETTAPPEYVAPDVDYDGAEVTFAVIDYVTSGQGGVWAASNYCEGFMPEQNGDPLNDSIYERNTKVEEELNVKIKIYSLSSFSNGVGEFKKPVLAGDDVIDLCLMNAGKLSELLGTGMLLDLQTLGLDLSKSWWDQGSVEELNLLGKLYTATGDISLNAAFAPITYFFNKKLVSDFSLKDPYQMVNDGTWTLDVAMDMCYTVAGDLNGNGQTDIEDRFGMLFETASIPYMLQAGGMRYTVKDSDGVPQLALNTEKTAKMLEMIAPFVADKATNILASNYSGYKNTFTDLMLPMFIDDRALFYNNQLLVALNLRNMNADFGVLPSPKYDEAQDEYYVPYSTWWSTFLIIPVTNSKPDMTCDFAQSAGYWSQQLIRTAYIDVTVMNKTLRDEDSVNMLDIILNNCVHDVGCIYNWGGMVGMLQNIGSNSFASTYASNESKIQAALDKTLETLRAE